MPELISGNVSFCELSKLQRFIDFFRYIFTGNSLYTSYHEIFNAVNDVDDTEILNKFIENERTKWRLLLCIARLIDITQDKYKNNYCIELIRTDDHGALMKLKYAEHALYEINVNDNDIIFIEENIFSKNSSKVIDFSGVINVSLECHLYECLDNYSKITEVCNKLLDINNVESEITLTVQENGLNSETKCSAEIMKECVDEVESTESNTIVSIDLFIRNVLKNETLNDIVRRGRKIGSGSYGTTYKIDDYVVKTPLNKYNIEIEFSGYNASSAPKRTSRYLNMANNDPDFSRAITMKRGGGGEDQVEILVSKFIEGTDITDEKEMEDALDELFELGFEIHDGDISGNILKASDGKYYFVDTDQMVISINERKSRRLTQATIKLENMLRDQYRMEAHKEKQSGEHDGFYTEALLHLNDLITEGGG